VRNIMAKEKPVVVAEAKEPMVLIQIGADQLNKGKEQFKVYQLDGVTIQVAIGKIAKVPLWVAEAAVRAGDIESFDTI